MEYLLTLYFLTQGGLKSTFSINGVRPDLTPAEVISLMDTIIARNVFTTNSGALVGKADAKFTERKVTKYDVA